MSQEDRLDQKYQLGNVSFYKIRNRTERRVIKLLPEVLQEYPEYDPEMLDLQDIYALTLNSLPPHYVQEFSIVLQEKTDNEQIKRAIRQAVEKVIEKPTEQRSFME